MNGCKGIGAVASAMCRRLDGAVVPVIAVAHSFQCLCDNTTVIGIAVLGLGLDREEATALQGQE